VSPISPIGRLRGHSPVAAQSAVSRESSPGPSCPASLPGQDRWQCRRPVLDDRGRVAVDLMGGVVELFAVGPNRGGDQWGPSESRHPEPGGYSG
jgi:hypothetical protein